MSETFEQYMARKKKKTVSAKGKSFEEYMSLVAGDDIGPVKTSTQRDLSIQTIGAPIASSKKSQVVAPAFQEKMDNIKSSLEKKKSSGETKEIPKQTVTGPVKEEKDTSGFLKKPKAFEDGYQFGDILKTGTANNIDTKINLIKGAGGVVEGVLDLLGYGAAGLSDLLGADKFADNLKNVTKANAMETVLGPVSDIVNQYSSSGDLEDAVTQGVGQVGLMIATGVAGGAAGLGAKGVASMNSAIMGSSAMGSGMGEAYANNATDEEALLYGTISGASAVVTEMIFGGLGKAVNALGFSKGLSSADDMLAKKLSSKISNVLFKNAIQFGIKAGAEGTEEALDGFVNALGKKITYMSEEDLCKIIEDEDLLEQFIVGTFTSGFAQSGDFMRATTNGADFITGLKETENSVVEKVYNDIVAKEEANGKKLTNSEKKKLYDATLNALEKGYIDTGTIESVLGGKEYNAYKSVMDKETALKEEYDALKNEHDSLNRMVKDRMTGEQQDRLYELKQQLPKFKSQIDNYNATSNKAQIKAQLDSKMKGLVEGNRLAESYNEVTRRRQTFEADLSQYNSKQQETVKRAIESGVLNNTNKTHDFVNMIAKLSADKGLTFDFANNQKLKETGFALRDGVTINGFVNKKTGNVTVNIDSVKALNSVVGHEITHVLEGTELYNELQGLMKEYAGEEYNTRYDALSKLYEEGTDIDKEVVADLVGDLLFTDSDFVNRLSVEKPNLFKRIYDEIKYLCKVATPGSKQAKELEKIKKVFEGAYKESGVHKATTEPDVKFSVGNVVGESGKDYGIGVILDSDLLTGLNDIERKQMVKLRVEELAGSSFVAYDNGNPVEIHIAEKNEKIKTRSGIKKPVIKELYNKYNNDQIKQESVVLADELIETSKYGNTEASNYSHDWLDNYGQNNWEKRTVYIQDKNKAVYEAVLQIANAADGRRILYDIYPIKEVEGAIMSAPTTTTNSISQNSQNATSKSKFSDTEHTNDGDIGPVKKTEPVKAESPLLNGAPILEGYSNDADVNYSLSENTDSTGRQLTKGQQEYFKDSKAVDENGSLKLVYHGTRNANFTVFNRNINFFTDSKEMADSYAPTGDMFEGYINITKPYEIDAKGEKWSKIPIDNATKEFLQKYGAGVFNEGGVWRTTPSDIAYAIEDAIENGDVDYDGVIIKNIDDTGSYYKGKESNLATDYIVFNSNQFKNADNQKPSADADIRYSLSDIENMDRIKYNQYGWTKVNDVLSRQEYAHFFAKVGEIKKNGTWHYDLGNGKHMVEVGEEQGVNNTLIITDVSYKTPSIDRVYHINLFSETDIEIVRDMIYDDEKNGRWPLPSDDIENFYGLEVVRSYSAENFQSFSELSGEYQRRKSEGNLRIDKGLQDRRRSSTTDSANGINQENAKVSSNDDAFFDGEKSLSRDDDIGPVRSTYGKDVALEQRTVDGTLEDIGPVRELPATSNAYMDTDIGPVSEELSGTKDIKTLEQRLEAKRKAVETEITNNRKFRSQSNEDFESDIAELQARYEGKKKKDTKAANDILRSIERKRRLQSSIDADYAKRISDLEARAEKMKTPEYKTAMQRKEKQTEYSNLMENLVGDTSTWKDKKLGISYATNTLRRNLRYVVRDENGNQDFERADAIYDELQGNYNANEAKLNRESNAIKKPYADLDITPAEDAYIQMLGEFRHNPDTTLTRDVVENFYDKNKDKIDTQKVDRIIKDARETYDTLLLRVNKVLKEQGFKEIPYRKGYFPHFTDVKQGFIAKLLNWKPSNKDNIPTDIAGITEQFKPNRSWQAFSKERKSDKTDYSFTKGLDAYVNGALDWIYHIEDIQKRRAFENHIRYVHSEKGIQEKVDEIKNDESFDTEEAQKEMEKVYDEARNPLNNFVTDLRTGTNTLAGKKSSYDRGMEQLFNREIYSTMTNINSRVSANLVAGSFSAAISNFIPITKSWAQVSPWRSVQAMREVVKNAIKDDGTVDKSNFLTNRLNTAENLYKTNWDKVSDKLGFMMEAVDEFTSQVVWRSKYIDNMSNGMSEAEAVKNADQFAENVIAGRSRGNMPTLFDAKGFVPKMFTLFQLEVNNDYGYLFQDVPQDMRNEATGKLIKGYVVSFLGTYALNTLLSSLTGRDMTLDPIGMIQDILRDIFGGDDEEKEPADIIINATDSILDQLPFISSFTGGGRVPLSSALPYGEGIYETFAETIKDIGEKDGASLTKEWLNPLLYLAMPMGGGQLKKTIQGLSMFDDDLPISGSYTNSGNLRFPVEDTLGNRVKAGIFGQWASKNARDYFDNERAPLKEKQIQEYKDLDLPIRDYWEYREGLAKQKSLEDKFDYISDLDVSVEQKNIMVNNVVNRKEPVDMTNYDDFSNYDEFDFYCKNKEKYNFLQDNDISYAKYTKYKKKYDSIYSWYKNNPEKVLVSKAVTDDVIRYKEYVSDLNEIKADKDANGKAISGSAKKKQIEYINDLDLDYGQKIILYRTYFDSESDKAAYNYDIVEYLNGRDDISRSDMVTILEELDMTVHPDGTVEW